MRQTLYIFSLIFAAVILTSCKGGSKADSVQREEDKEAKQLLQGIWVNDDDEEVLMKVKGDTIIYADSTMAPVYFAIIGDSLITRGYTETKYLIVKQAAHLFQFKNANGDILKLVKSENPYDKYIFENRPASIINQGQLIKRDSVIMVGDKKYHIYTQINPSRYKVIRSTINQNGVKTDNVYYDNIINVCIYDCGNRLFSRDVHKQDLAKFVPADYMNQAILSDVTIDKVVSTGIELLASVCVPDSPTSYVVRLIVSPSGKLSMKMD